MTLERQFASAVVRLDMKFDPIAFTANQFGRRTHAQVGVARRSFRSEIERKVPLSSRRVARPTEDVHHTVFAFMSDWRRGLPRFRLELVDKHPVLLLAREAGEGYRHRIRCRWHRPRNRAVDVGSPCRRVARRPMTPFVLFPTAAGARPVPSRLLDHGAPADFWRMDDPVDRTHGRRTALIGARIGLRNVSTCA